MTAYPSLTVAPAPKPRRTGRLARLAKTAASAALLCALLCAPGQALAVNDDAVLRRMDSVLEENARLRDEVWKARKNGRDAAKQAEDALNASDDRVERTRAEALAHVAGVSPAQVESLRKDGRSWGQAAGELGVHPGFLGVGKTPLYEPQSARRKAAAENAKLKRGGKVQEPQPKAAGKKGKGAKAAVKADAEKKPGQKSAKKGAAKAEKKSDKKTEKKGKKAPQKG